MALQFTRNAEVYVALKDSDGDHKQSWKLTVLDGFSFSQAINSSEITINESGTTSRRARLLFNDSLAPVEWSMSTYARPFLSVSPAVCRAPEDVLWAMFCGADAYDAATGVYKKGTSALNTITAALNTFDFSQSNVSSMPDNWDIWFSFEDGENKQYYKLDSSVVNSVSMDFDIDGIATLQWSGFAKNLSDEGTTTKPDQLNTTPATGDPLIATGLISTTNFIRNRISTLDLVRLDKLIGSAENPPLTSTTTVTGVNNSGQATLVVASVYGISVGDTVSVPTVVVSSQTVASINATTKTLTLSANLDAASVGGEEVTVTHSVQDNYNIVLTGGNISMENNITYLSPEELGIVNAPLANITGARSISGSLTCYLDNDQSTSKSGELFADLVADTTTVRNVFNVSINVGGATAATPRVSFDIPTAHLEVPTINVEDLLTLEINFHGQVSDGNVDRTDEATIIYKV